MAIPSVRAVGSLTSSSTSGFSVTLPTHAADDILLLVIEQNDASTNDVSGWARVADSPTGITSSSCLDIWWKRATSGAESNPVVTGTVATANHWVAIAISVQGCITSGDPWDVTATGATTGTTTATCGGDTTTVADCLVFLAVGTTNNATASGLFSNWANSDLASITEHADQSHTVAGGGGWGIITGTKAAAGTIGNTTVDISTSNASRYLLIALKPPDGSANVTPATGSLTVTGFAPTISVSDNKSATPATGTITLTGFTPTVSLSDNKDATPGTATITLTGFAPTVSLSDNKDATPGTASIVITGFAPTISVTTNTAVTPGTASITVTGFAPTVAVACPVMVRNPTSDIGANGTWTGSFGTRYQSVDDHPDTTGADVLTHGTAAGNISFGFTAFDVPATTTGIERVSVVAYMKKNSAAAVAIGGRIRVAGVNYVTAEVDLTEEYALYRFSYTTNPNTTVAWTRDDVNGVSATDLEVFGLTCSDANPTIALASIQLEVQYCMPDDPKEAIPGTGTITLTGFPPTVSFTITYVPEIQVF